MTTGNASEDESSQSQGRLTSIGDAYTLAATNEPEPGEVEDLMVKHFIETLAEVALSVASRRLAKKEETQ